MKFREHYPDFYRLLCKNGKADITLGFIQNCFICQTDLVEQHPNFDLYRVEIKGEQWVEYFKESVIRKNPVYFIANPGEDYGFVCHPHTFDGERSNFNL